MDRALRHYKIAMAAGDVESLAQYINFFWMNMQLSMIFLVLLILGQHL